VRALALAPVLALVLGAGSASAAGATCGSTQGLVCSTVVVPLDRSGVIPGTISLHVEELPAPGPSNGAVFIIAGGPGQGSAHVFDLGDPSSAEFMRFLFPGYTVVAYDDRGTGDSGLLNCPALQSSLSANGQDVLAAACASSIGPGANLYGTADHVADLDAVRQSLGFQQVALYGVSYGTKLALAYAYAHPANVSRMVLDSVLPTDLPDPYSANVARAMPATLQAFCSTGACSAATSDFAGDVVAVANRLAAKPARGQVLLADGKTKRDTLGGVDLLSVIVDSDLNPGLAAELPAAVHAARLGDVAPLLRLHLLDTEGSTFSAADLSAGLYAATDCRDGPFPWPADSTPATRPALLKQEIAALPPGTFGPFGTWASELGNASLCDLWPTPAGGVNLASGPLPNVPVLALSGGFDMRTPTAGAQSVIAQFPQGKLLVVPGIGHSVTTADPSGCAAAAVHDWMLDPTNGDTCQRPEFLVAPIGAFPKPPPAGRRATPTATFAIALKTIQESEAAWLLANLDASPPVPGLTSGKIVQSGRDGYRLVAYGLVPGVTVSGSLKLAERSGVTLKFDGLLTVAGASASRGTLQVSAKGLNGTLGGRSVSAR
jgi:pimeloyl-ACP methyl ester carboxylesterase